MDSERKAAEKFVDLMLPADPKASVHGDEAFLIHFDREVELLEDFTNSREKLDHEIDAMTPTSQEHNNQGPETSGDDHGYGGHGDSSHGGGTQLYDAIYLSSDELMKPKDGRKALVIFSDGVDRGSKETLNDAIDAADRAGVQVFTIYFKGEEERGENGFPGGHHGGMGGGGGYPGGGGGWPGGGGGGGHHPGGTNAPQLDGKKIMQEIASRTGGQFFEAKKKDNLDDIYGLIAGALRQQYLLTYTPDKVDTDGDFHKIALKTDKRRPDRDHPRRLLRDYRQSGRRRLVIPTRRPLSTPAHKKAHGNTVGLFGVSEANRTVLVTLARDRASAPPPPPCGCARHAAVAQGEIAGAGWFGGAV